MHWEWVEGAIRALDNDFGTFDEVQDIHSAARVVLDLSREPMASRFDKLALVQPGAFFAPFIAPGHYLLAVHQIPPDPFGPPIPLNVFLTVVDVNGSWFSIETQTAPVPQFEGENVRCGADLKNHAVPAGAVDRACGNREVIMFR